MLNLFVKFCFVLILEERYWELKWILDYSDVLVMCNYVNLVFLINYDVMILFLNLCKFCFILWFGGV